MGRQVLDRVRRGRRENSYSCGARKTPEWAKAPVAHQRGAARSAAWPSEQVLDGPLQDIVGREIGGDFMRED
jgi:hypothetical protein